MRRLQLNSAGLPETHPTVLIVKTRPDFKVPMTTMGGAGVADLGAMPGIDLLARMSNFGKVRRITLLARADEESSPSLAVPMGGALSGTPASLSWAMSAWVSPKPTPKKRGERVLAGAAVVESDTAAAASEASERLRFDPAISSASPAPARYLMLARKAPILPLATPTGAPFWNLRSIRLDRARAKTTFREAAGIKVAVLDTGIDAKHPDLSGRVAKYHFQYPDNGQVVGAADIVGHGTHVSGTIAADAKNGYGIEGICRPSLHVWKIFTDQALLIPSLRQYLYVVDPVMYQRALADCADLGVSVLNLSIGGPQPPDPVESELFSALLQGGTTVVAAMGNERQWGSPVSYPAAIPGVIAVGATKIDDGVAPFSNRGSHISLCAPGVAIWSTLPTHPGRSGFEAVSNGAGAWKEGKPLSRDTDFDAWDGTSMATPHVTAAAALYIAQNPGANPQEVRKALMGAADRIAGMGSATFHQDYGAGRLNLERLL